MRWPWQTPRTPEPEPEVLTATNDAYEWSISNVYENGVESTKARYRVTWYSPAPYDPDFYGACPTTERGIAASRAEAIDAIRSKVTARQDQLRNIEAQRHPLASGRGPIPRDTVLRSAAAEDSR